MSRLRNMRTPQGGGRSTALIYVYSTFLGGWKLLILGFAQQTVNTGFGGKSEIRLCRVFFVSVRESFPFSFGSISFGQQPGDFRGH